MVTPSSRQDLLLLPLFIVHTMGTCLVPGPPEPRGPTRPPGQGGSWSHLPGPKASALTPAGAGCCQQIHFKASPGGGCLNL